MTSNKSGKASSKVVHGHVDFSSMDKAEVSKALYGQIQWEQLPSSGVFLQHKDVRLVTRTFLEFFIFNSLLAFWCYL
jgi:hypothetical protein